jgi:hypothetical protein
MKEIRSVSMTVVSLRLDNGCYPHGNYLVSDGCCQGHAGISIPQPSLIEIKQQLVLFSWTLSTGL